MKGRAMLARVMVALAVLALPVLAACTPALDAPSQPATSAPGVKPAAVKIGVVPTEDVLPLWVAEKMGYFATNGLDSVELVVFESEQERDAAFAAGEVDALAGDIVAAAQLEAGGAPATIATVMLGADQNQGRFAVVVPADSKAVSMADLKGVAVGTSLATIQEYVLDGLMSEAGVATKDAKIEEVKKAPEGFESLMAGKLKAAVLPEPYVTLAEQGGAKVVGDDTKAQDNRSQTVLVFSDGFVAKVGGPEAVSAVLGAWDVAVGNINASPDAYRADLAQKAGLPESLVETYKVNTYPTAAPPTQAQVDAVLTWMRDKGYLKADVGYGDLVTTQ